MRSNLVSLLSMIHIAYSSAIWRYVYRFDSVQNELPMFGPSELNTGTTFKEKKKKEWGGNDFFQKKTNKLYSQSDERAD